MGIEAGILVEELEQQMNNFIIEKTSRSYIGISEENRDFLESIANYCTKKGGNAVFVARTLLTLLDSTNRTYNDICYQQGSRIRNTVESLSSNIEIKVQPNPANENILNSILGIIENTNYDFEIINIHGKLIEKRSSSNAQNELINTEKYASGIYTIKTNIEGKVIASKFIIAH